MKTIGKNHSKQIAALKLRIVGVTAYNLGNNFVGAAGNIERIDGILADWVASRGARLWVDGDKVTVHFHSNRWVEFVLSAE